MKVALINSFNNGSTGMIMNSLSDALKSQGFESICLYGRDKQESKSFYIGSSYLSTKFNNFLVYFSGNVGGYHKGNTKRLIKQLREFGPDIIHLHNIHNNYLNYDVLFEYLASFKGQIIITLHDQFLFTGHCGSIPPECNHFSTNCDKCEFKNIYQMVAKDRCKELLEKKKQYFEKLKHVTIVSPSKWLDSFVENSYLNKFKHLIINNGFNIIPAKIKDTKNERIRLLAVASYWYETKGLSILNQLANLLDNNKYELVVVGELEKKSDSFSDKITQLGRLTKEEVYQEMNKADILINPTLVDNFPTVLIESLMNGLPVISFDSGGCKEIIDDKTGVILKERTAESLYKAICEFDFNKYTFDNCVKRSLMFKEENMTQKYINLYKELLN